MYERNCEGKCLLTNSSVYKTNAGMQLLRVIREGNCLAVNAVALQTGPPQPLHMKGLAF